VTEVERKLEVPTSFVVPDLSAVPGVAGPADPRLDELEAVYLDTVDLRLLRRRLTLRRRTGGPDAGWHLKRPARDGERTELRLPLGRSAHVPTELSHLVAAITRGEPLVPVVRMRTHRVVHPVLAADGRVLAEIAVDDVAAAQSLATTPRQRWAPPERWREVEVELVDGDAEVLAALVAALVEAGAEPSPHASKLARALGRESTVPGSAADIGDGGPADAGSRRSSGAVVGGYLSTHVARLLAWDPRTRADEPDALHQLRVTARRLRSALSTFRPLLDRPTVDELRAELGWLGRQLSEARDVEVIRAHLLAEVTELEPELVKGPVVQQIRETYDTRYRKGHDGALAAMDSTRYYALLDRLEALVADPPWTAAAGRRVEAELVPLLADTWRRLRKLHRRLDDLGRRPDPVHRDELLHEIRKQAKRSRYAAEVLRSQATVTASRWGQVMGELQEVLGEQHDSVVVRAQLLELAQVAAAAGEDGFTYGVLSEQERQRGRRAEDVFDAVWRTTKRAMTARGRR
jgi:CHAD domain-containing protein